eukprot:3685602-Amphidinium_carterae.2
MHVETHGEKRKAEEELVAEVQTIVAGHANVIGSVSDEDISFLCKTMKQTSSHDQWSDDCTTWHVDDCLELVHELSECQPEGETQVGMEVDHVILTQEDVDMLVADEKRELDNMVDVMNVIAFDRQNLD